MLKESKTKRSAYIIMGDIVNSTAIYKAGQLNWTLRRMFDILEKQYRKYSYGEGIMTYPLGDGFVSILIFGEDGYFNATESLKIIDLCRDILATACKREKKRTPIELRLGVSCGQVTKCDFTYTTSIPHKSETISYFIGKSIAECSRLMSFGDDRHLIASEVFYCTINQSLGDAGGKYKATKQIQADKKAESYTFYTILEENEKNAIFNRKQPILKHPQPALKVADIQRFQQTIRANGLFYSITLIDAQSWINDHALLTVLIQQAAKDTVRTFKRLFIWDEIIDNVYTNCLRTHHDTAKIEQIVKRRRDIQCVANTIKEQFAPKRSPLIQFWEDPFKEAWLCCPKDDASCSIESCENRCAKLEGGFGIFDENTQNYIIHNIDNESILEFRDIFIKLFLARPE